jgi:hypothetical protein
MGHCHKRLLRSLACDAAWQSLVIDSARDRETGFERLRRAPIPNRDSPIRTGLLQALYARINTMLAHAIIKLDDRKEPQPIDLVSERTRGTVDELFEKRDQIDPFFAAMGIGQTSEWESGDFRAAFDLIGVCCCGELGEASDRLLHFRRDAVVHPRNILHHFPSSPDPGTRVCSAHGWVAGGFGA